MVIWITGKKGAGKTTLAYEIKAGLNKAVVLDGDEIRAIYPADFSDEGRKNNITRIGQLAGLIEMQGFTAICALVSPKKEWRDEARSYAQKSELIYVEGGTLWPGTTYETPDANETDMIYNWRIAENGKISRLREAINWRGRDNGDVIGLREALNG